ncbi:CHASE3 domain-containing protein [Noviherbaspirillum sp. CPCC 100848]|uniref:histidine kinase n=1 Tax=Noviherbaspirillum album TaxID=3080276 RepID=A0ABU6JKL4_9BURK|nr:CHASE3 domain-containing protein [Noviherbaspirillum sp. CPCC 100848]MEC4723837.1 CHASE3 domain-containing protein [Noviherbaspirillum sp. CPCC 100848]
MAKLQHLSFNRFLLPFLLVAVGLVFTVYIGKDAVGDLIANQRSEASARATVLELQNLMTQALNAETGQRGYMITGSEHYLLPYETALRELPQALMTLERRFKDDAPQLARLRAFRQQQELKFAELAETIGVRRNQGFEAAQQLVRTDRGRDYMLRMRAEVDAMLQAENHRLNARIEDSGRSAEKGMRIIVLAALVNLGLLGLAFGVVRIDNLARQRASVKLEEARNLLRSVIDGSPALIFLKDTHGKFILVNKAFEEFTGRTAGAIIGKTSADLFAHDIAQLHLETDRQAMQGSQAVRFEESVVDARSGELRHFISAKVPLLGAGGKLTGVCGVSSDITSLKAAETEIRAINQVLEKRVEQRTSALQEANGHLEAFSYTVAHDLRAPLRGIQGFAEAIAEDYAPVLDDTGKDYLVRIEKAAMRMERLIEDLLSFARLARTDLGLAPVRLSDALDEALRMLAAPIRDTRAEIEIGENLPTVRANHAACVQVLQNLLSNALKFSLPREVPRIRIGSELREGRARLWVRDAGIGIDPRQSERIFRPFERLHGQEAFAGTGIGLAIVDKATRRMGGDCGVESEPGKGACFWIELPLHSREAQ